MSVRLEYRINPNNDNIDTIVIHLEAWNDVSPITEKKSPVASSFFF